MRAVVLAPFMLLVGLGAPAIGGQLCDRLDLDGRPDLGAACREDEADRELDQSRRAAELAHQRALDREQESLDRSLHEYLNMKPDPRRDR